MITECLYSYRIHVCDFTNVYEEQLMFGSMHVVVLTSYVHSLM